MKKIAALALALTLLLTSVAFAAEDRKTIKVTLELKSVYEWSIPESIKIVENPTAGQNQFDITVSKFVHMDGFALMVSNNTRCTLQRKGFSAADELDILINNGDASHVGYTIFDDVGKATYTVTFADPAKVAAAPAGEYTADVTFTATVIPK